MYLASNGLSQQQIAKELKITPAAVSQHIKKLTKENYIKSLTRSTFKSLILEVKALPEIARLVPNSLTPNLTPQEAREQGKETIRAHRLLVKFHLRNKLPSDQPRKIAIEDKLNFTNLNLKNQASVRFASNRLTLELYPSSLVIQPENYEAPITADIEQIEAYLIKSIIDTALDYELRHKEISFIRDTKGRLEAEVITEEIALTNNPIAKDTIAKKEKLYVYDQDTNELMFKVDLSNGYPEFEAVNAKTAPLNATEAQQALAFMGTGNMRKWVTKTTEQLAEDRELVHEIVKDRAEYGKEIHAHVEAVKEMKQAATEQKQAATELREALVYLYAPKPSLLSRIKDIILKR